MVPLDLASVTAHTLIMSLLSLLGAIAILLGILGLAGVIGTSVGIEIALFVIGVVLIALDNRSSLNL